MSVEVNIHNINWQVGWREYLSRREAEDEAATAFAQLPEKKRREMLSKLYGAA